MTNDQQQEQASLYAAGALTPEEQKAFELQLGENADLRTLVSSLRSAAGLMALSVPQVVPPLGLKNKVLQRIDEKIRAGGQKATRPTDPKIPGFSFVRAGESKGWKQLPIPGAWIKCLSLEKERGYAVLMGRLEAGVRYPAHLHEQAEEIYILTGDLHIGDRRLEAGDFHHADAGTAHPVNYSENGCTLLAVLPADHELVQFATA